MVTTSRPGTRRVITSIADPDGSLFALFSQAPDR
jgi:hypothetical protein